MEPPSSASSLRVLMRPPPPAATAATPPPPPLPTSSSLPSNPFPSSSASASASADPTPPEGVVVVGFVGSRPTADVASLANHVLDAYVFGSGGLDADLLASSRSKATHEEDWLKHRKISYYYDEERAVVFLLFSSLLSPALLLATRRTDGGCDGPASDLEEYEASDLRGMLFMFSVCHVIVFLHEGVRFDTSILKKFRMLQAAKHALAPFIRTQITPMLAPKASSSSVPERPTVWSTVFPPSRRGASTSRHASAISLMSGSGSHPSVLPGQCTPVILFVFVDDFLDSSGPSAATNMEDLADTSSTNQSSSMSGVTKPSSNIKGSTSVVMLARPTSKAEGNFKKKLHSSLESQIRFLIKKCRTLVGTEPGHLGPRGVGNLSSLPLFSLDATRISVLLDRSMYQRGEPLDFVSGLIEDAFDSKGAVDMFMLESHCQTLNNEDIQLIKDFVYRQSDTLRGRGGLPSNANSGSVAGVGMVAAAAAAAAASAAAGKPISAPELPTINKWLSLSSLILEVLLPVKHGLANEIGSTNRLFVQRSGTEVQNERNIQLGTVPIEAAISCLESGKGLNVRFSTSWCQRALPAAKEVYLKDLPACYPTSLHKTQLEMAMRAFLSMVKGPAVQMFAKKLEDECTLIWESGRQLCDAVSLTGKPCMHQRHNGKTSDSSAETVTKKHSSGYVFLHACACGRSRHLREDPFDFDSANITFNFFSDCENLLPTLVLPKGSNTGSLPPNSWSLVRIGGAKYYKPFKGLLQIGFCSTEKYLLKWTISLAKWKGTSSPPASVASNSYVQASRAVSFVDEAVKKSNAAYLPNEIPTGGSENQKKSSGPLASNDSNISFGKGLPSFTMKKPFSEVVANNVFVDSTGPILQKRKQSKANPEKDARQMGASDQTGVHVYAVDDRKISDKTEHYSVNENSNEPGVDSNTNGSPFLQIGSNMVPVNMSSAGKMISNGSLKQVIVYVGFEHECSYGHRFLLSSGHLNELNSVYSSPKKAHSFAEDSNRKYQETKNSVHEKFLPYSGIVSSTVNDAKKGDGCAQSALPSDAADDLVGNLPRVRLDDDGPAFSLLNRNLPLYMNCPHCRSSKRDSHQKTKFASTVSQLQRIFVVTPPFPTALATCPVIKFEDSCLPPSVPDREQQSQFSFGCQVILPPESFVTLRLPFVYGVRMDDGNLHPLKYLEHQPEVTAWLMKGTTLQVVSREHVYDEFHMQ